MSFYSDASLVLLPKGGAGKDGKVYSIKPTDASGDFTFDRGSNLSATRVNASGLIEKGTENFLIYSNDFSNAAWDQSATTRTSGQSGYDGTSDAWQIVRASGGAIALTQTINETGLLTFSIYVKINASNGIGLSFGSINGIYARFNISDDQQTSAASQSGLVSSTQEYVGNNFYRLSITADTTETVVRLFITAADGSGADSTGGTHIIQDSQLEIGLVPTTYVESGASEGKGGLLEDEPRFDYHDPSSSSAKTCPSLQFDPERTNLFKHSEYFDSGTYAKEGNLTITTNSINSPEGLKNASLFVSDNATSEQRLKASGLAVDNTSNYTFSVFAKKKDFDFLQLRFLGTNSAFTAGGAWFNISSGTVGTVQTDLNATLTASIENYGDGWYRCILTATSTAAANAVIRIQLASSDDDASVVGDGSKGTYVYGAQFEKGDSATSYIPNQTTGTITRSADKTSTLTYDDDIESMTVFAEVNSQDIIRDSGTSNLHIGRDGNTAGAFFLRRNATANKKKLQVSFRANDDSNVFTSYELPAGDCKIALKYNRTDGATKLFVNGATDPVATGSSTNMDEFDTIFLSGDGGNFGLKQLVIFTSSLTDSDCITLTE